MPKKNRPNSAQLAKIHSFWNFANEAIFWRFTSEISLLVNKATAFCAKCGNGLVLLDLLPGEVSSGTGSRSQGGDAFLGVFFGSWSCG